MELHVGVWVCGWVGVGVMICNCFTQLHIITFAKFYTTYRVLDEQNRQLNTDLEQAKVQLSAALPELERLKAREDALQLLVQQQKKEISVWKQACDAKIQQLEAVAALATVSKGLRNCMVYTILRMNAFCTLCYKSDPI